MNIALPAAFDVNIYRNTHPDLKAAGFDDNGLTGHYERHGRAEGRACSTVRSRADFLALIPADINVLELCPGFTPSLTGPNIRYYDRETRGELATAAAALNVSTASLADIDYVSPTDDMSGITATFDMVVSIHDIGRHPNLVKHLQGIEALLNPGGHLFCAIPDKRYTNDYFSPEATLTTVIARHETSDNEAGLDRTLATTTTAAHTSGPAHWAGRHGSYTHGLTGRMTDALAHIRSGQPTIHQRHINTHLFTPDSFCSIIDSLRALSLTSLRLAALYPAVYGKQEFFAVLTKQ